MKKTFLIFLSLILVFCISSCGDKKEPVSSVNTPISSEITEVSSNKTESEGTDYTELKATVSQKAKAALSEVVTNNMTEVEKAKISYDWLFFHFKYRAMAVDLSKGYTDELTLDLADYYFKYHKGSCEHYAAAQKVLLEELGFNVRYVEGERYDAANGVWGEHVWVMMQVDGNWYHVDGLFGGNHTASLASMFCVPDSAIENTHRWEKSNYPACVKPQILK